MGSTPYFDHDRPGPGTRPDEGPAGPDTQPDGGFAGLTAQSDDGLAGLGTRVRAFVRDRDWEQFHTPKNLAMALAGEVGELLAELQWLTPEESAAVMADEAAGARVAAEIGDVMIYLVQLADSLNLDLVRAAHEKLTEAEQRYPAERVRGRAAKAVHG